MTEWGDDDSSKIIMEKSVGTLTARGRTRLEFEDDGVTRSDDRGMLTEKEVVRHGKGTLTKLRRTTMTEEGEMTQDTDNGNMMGMMTARRRWYSRRERGNDRLAGR